MISDNLQQKKIRMKIKDNFFIAQLFKVWAFDKVEMVAGCRLPAAGNYIHLKVSG